MAGKGWAMKEDAGRGWRRVVPSPKPLKVLEPDALKSLLNEGYIVIAGGGGGVPVAKNRHKLYYGTEAVIDKDLTSSLIATELCASTLLILTAVEHAFIHFGTQKEEALGKIKKEKLREYFEAGEFKEGSMAPKVEACLKFLDNGGDEAIITSIPSCLHALRGKTGTRITA